MLSDLNLSSMSEDCLDWSTLLPTRNQQQQQQQSATKLGDVPANTTNTLSLQDAFQKSKKSFIERSKVRQESVNQAAIDHYEKHQAKVSAMAKTKVRQSKSKQQQTCSRFSTESSSPRERIPSTATSTATTTSDSGDGKLDKGLFVVFTMLSENLCF